MKRIRPAVDEAIRPVGGVSRDGQPISYNRAPAPDLAPWIARLYGTVVEAPDGHRLSCGLFNDAAVLRIQVRGDWEAHAVDGLLRHDRSALFFGPHTRRMPVAVTGRFASFGIALRPGACSVLKGPKLAENLDRILPCEVMGITADALIDAIDPDAHPEESLCAIEAILREHIASLKVREPDPITARFETLCFTNPSSPVRQFADECGLDLRKLERIVRRDFGLPPKQVMRRARALDMASHLRGVADMSEADELVLRFYDQSHLIREFVALFGMSPSQFVATPQPILTLALESRQARRLELIERITPGEARPWQ